MKYKFDYTAKFKRDYRKINDKNILAQLDDVIERLLNGEVLEPKYKDHQLSGNFKGFRDCHIRPDLVLIYKKEDDILVLTAVRLGSHSDLFKK